MKDCIAILVKRNAAGVTASWDGRTYCIFQCSTANCGNILIKEKRADNYMTCARCLQNRKNRTHSERTRLELERGDAQYALDSKTPLCALNPEQISKQNALRYAKRKWQANRIIFNWL